MAAMHHTSSCQDLIRANRPGFPEGLKVLVVMKDTAARAAAKKVLEGISYKVTTVASLEEGLSALNSAASSEAITSYDVALIEGKLVEVLLSAAAAKSSGSGGSRGSSWEHHVKKKGSAGGAGSEGESFASSVGESLSSTLSMLSDASSTHTRFTSLAKDVAIVLMHEEDDAGSKSYMIEAIRAGVVAAVVKFPLVRQPMRTLWQHAVRKMLRQQQAGEAKAGGGDAAASKKAAGDGDAAALLGDAAETKGSRSSFDSNTSCNTSNTSRGSLTKVKEEEGVSTQSAATSGAAA
eukprot:CAMPEP_0197588042 /NCGR_PEP_ID=MMETSP1326-20131121/9463_1 /TAXON_ID=1155430 /ORGANISM="Genus nov. species nov., Strain RCC2288" /LENGTH=292 /DNA_ID=CAMNT_0043152833 /DNA_START=271 /DNA_END=1146 /DNA_ORIENTATION=-